MEEQFHAGAQYNDWRGEMFVDENSDRGVREFLKERGLHDENKFLIGIEFYRSDSREFSLAAYFVDARNYEEANEYLINNIPPTVHKVEVDSIPHEEFLRFFRRVSVALSWQDFNLIGKTLKIIEHGVE